MVQPSIGENFIRYISEPSTDAVLILQDGVVIYANPIGVGLFGQRDDRTLIGQSFADCFLAVTGKPFPPLQSELQNGKWATNHFPASVRDSNGNNLDLELYWTHILGPDPAFIVVKAKRIRDEEAFITAEREPVVSTADLERWASIGSWSHNLISRTSHCSDGMFRIHGISPELSPDHLARSIFLLIHPQDQQRVRDVCHAAIAGQVVEPMEYRIIRPDGAERILWSRIETRQRSAAGRPEVLVGTIQDITHWKKTEEAFEESALNFSTLFHAGSVCLSLSSLEDGRFIDVNDAFLQMTGYTRAEVLGRTSEELGLWLDPTERIRLKYLILTLGRLEEAERTVRKKNGEHSIVSVVVLRVQIAKNDFLLILMKDLTDHKRIENEILRLNTDLEHRVSERTHELEALYAIAFIGNESVSLSQYLDRVLDVILSVTKITRGMILTVDPATHNLHQAAERGWPALAGDAPSPCADSAPIIHRVFRDETAFYSTHDENSAKRRCRLNDDRPCYFCALPLKTQGDALGVLALCGDSNLDLGLRKAALLSSITTLIAAALEKESYRRLAMDALALEERQRWARELHDSITQSLFTIANYASAVKYQLRTNDITTALLQMENLEKIARLSLRETRLLIHELRSSVMEDGLVPALRTRLGFVENRSGVIARLESDNWPNLPENIESELYGIAIEALNNALRHANASEILVRLSGVEQHLRMEIIDNGKGFTLPVTNPGFGLSFMQERCKILGGCFTLDTNEEQGTRIYIEIAYPEGDMPTPC